MNKFEIKEKKRQDNKLANLNSRENVSMQNVTNHEGRFTARKV